MTASLGRAILLKRDTSATSTPSYTTVGGIKSRTITVNRETVDVTNSDSLNQWRELLADAGIRSMSVSGSGVFASDAAAKAVVAEVVSGTAFRKWQLVVPGLGTFEGLFAVTQCEFAGEHNGEETYSMSLESAAALTFTAET
ncbi:phage major tail protein, TP901-1 family [Pleomorphomonas oryzae]|uniref:phage major tail protein, TP901-1 family n=1 Tax=Pleomorphomonas oryzae TaxID=261934 RepID=UPI0004200702|nr:phage major tail protein, TP901-1 family [Pleomorphomonas oryzae]